MNAVQRPVEAASDVVSRFGGSVVAGAPLVVPDASAFEVALHTHGSDPAASSQVVARVEAEMKELSSFGLKFLGVADYQVR